VKRALTLLLLSAALLAGPACGLRPAGSRPAPAFTLATLEGGRVGLEDCGGKVCLLAIWASWCQPCREEIPGLNGLRSQFGEDLQILAVSVDEDIDALRAYLAEVEPAYPVALADEAFLRAVGHTGTLPTVIFVDREGKIRSRYAGYRPLSVLQEEAARLLGRRAAPQGGGPRT
jgi:thiol-disulfide isomerase/thioredoxin